MLHGGKEFSYGVEWKLLVSKDTIPHCQTQSSNRKQLGSSNGLQLVINLRCKVNSGCVCVLNANLAVVCVQVKKIKDI